MAVTRVDCPEDVQPEAGDVFTCTATGQDGTRAQITVTQKDDKGNVDISARALLANTSALESTLATKIGGDLDVDCPDLVTVSQGASFACKATQSSGRRSSIRVTFTDGSGNVRYACSLPLRGCTALDTGKTRAEIADALHARLGISVASVTCPTDVHPEAGGVFACTATGRDGTTATITVTQKNYKGEVRISAPLLRVAQLQSTLAGKLGGGVVLDCPDLVVAKRGTAFTCKARDAAGATSSVRVTFTDGRGHVRYRVQAGG